MTEQRPYAVLVPGPGLGHINGCLSLADSLHRVGFSVSVICFSTCFRYHSKANRMRKIPHYINLQILPDKDNLTDTAKDICYFELFFITDFMQQQLMAFMETLLQQHRGGSSSSCCIIPDIFMGPLAQPVAEKLGLPRVDLVTGNATSYLQVLALPDLTDRGYFDDEATVPDLYDIKGLQGLSRHELPKVPVDLLHSYILPGVFTNLTAERVLVHSTYELERSEFDSILKEYGVRAVAVGPLFADDVERQGYESDPDPCLTWLDSQAAGSVVYVSFGSNAALAGEEVAELALGLKASGYPFLWAIRSDAVGDGQEDISAVLLQGFLERVQTGMVVSWAPQRSVLAHPAVGGFLSHCGWNSTIESLWNGVPILACPRGVEQYTNARLVTNVWDCGIALTTKGIDRNDVRDNVYALMSGQQSRLLRSKALEIKDLLRKAVVHDGSSYSNLVQFAHDIAAFSSKK